MDKRGGGAALFFEILAVFMGLLLLIGLGARFHWTLEWVANLRCHFAAVLAVDLILLLILLRPFAFLFGVAALLTCGWFSKDTFIDQPKAVYTTAPSFRMMQWNIGAANGEHEAVLAAITEADPDVILLQEVTPVWSVKLRERLKDYELRMVESREDSFGIALFSRLRCRQHQVLRSLGADHKPSLFAEMIFEGQPFVLLGTHVVPPQGTEYAKEWQEHLEDISQYSIRQIEPLIVAGNLNTTPWNARMKKMCDLSGLKLASAHWYSPLVGTWPASMGPCGLRLDHVLVSDEFAVIDSRFGAGCGSMNRPMIVDVSLKY